MIIASFIFGAFSLLYIFGIAACVWQENELSLPHEKATSMTIFIVILSFVLFALAVYAFSQVSWDNLLMSKPFRI